MKTHKKIMILTVGICLIQAMCYCQPVGRRENQQRSSQSLTERQKNKVKAILSEYQVSTLTAKDAKAIHRAFREARIPGGPQLNEVVRNAGFNPEILKKLDPPEHNQRAAQRQNERPQRRQNERNRDNRQQGHNQYSIEQAVSDNAQLHTIAFSGLAFLTGDFGASTFIPPGKVCDFFGFQYMRDIDVAQKGHNPMFLNRVAGNVMHVLNDNQKQIFLDLAEKQAPKLEELAMMRLPLIKAFHMQRDNQVPAGSRGLSKEAVIQYVGDLFEFDVELSLERAEAMAKVFHSLTPEQKAYFAKMKFGDFNTWPDIDERGKLKGIGRGKSKLYNVAYMTYASEFFSWTAGSIQADTYFCPERHGTYFGGFYMKDMPAMGKRDYDISTSVTGDSGRAFLNDVLTPQQRSVVLEIPNKQRKLLTQTIATRKAISQELRKLLVGKSPDREKISSLGRRYGQLDGEMSWYYAIAFAQVNQTITPTQRKSLIELRNLDGYESASYYIYSEPARRQAVLKDVTSFFCR